MANSASDPTKSTPTPADPAVYLPGKRAVPDLPSAQGGSSHPPAGWWLIEHTVGYLWPNGHPDRLRAAATAWSTCADAVQGASYYLPEAVQGILDQQSPEVQDAFTVCNSMSEHIEDTAGACREVAKACTDFADGIDKAHHDVEHELIVLLEWTAAIEAGGLIAGIFTAGIGEGAAQAAEAARVTATASRVAKIIQTVVDLAGTLARAVSSVFSTIGKVAQRLLRIERAEVSEATVTAAAKVPEVAETAETVAVKGMEEAAAREQQLTSLNYPEKQLQAKFKHAKDFGVDGNWTKTSAREYQDALAKFAKDPHNVLKAGAYRGEPATLIYNEESKLCEILRPDGSYWSSWKLTDDQLEFVIKRGSLGGG